MNLPTPAFKYGQKLQDQREENIDVDHNTKATCVYADKLWRRCAGNTVSLLSDFARENCSDVAKETLQSSLRSPGRNFGAADCFAITYVNSRRRVTCDKFRDTLDPLKSEHMGTARLILEAGMSRWIVERIVRNLGKTMACVSKDFGGMSDGLSPCKARCDIAS